MSACLLNTTVLGSFSAGRKGGNQRIKSHEMGKKIKIVISAICFLLGPGITSASAQEDIDSFIRYNIEQLKMYNGEHYGTQLQLLDIEGKPAFLNKYRGKSIFLNLWFVGCKPCLDEIPYEQELQKRFQKDTTLVFVNLHVTQVDLKIVRQYIKDLKMPGENLAIGRESKGIDDGTLSEELKTDGFPTYILLDSNAQIKAFAMPEPSTGIVLDYILSHLNTGKPVEDLFREIYSQIRSFNAKDPSSPLYVWMKSFYEMEPLEYFLQRKQ